MATNTPEGKVKQAVREVLAKRGCYWFFPMQNGLGRVGIPDIIACLPVTITNEMVGKKIGVFVGIETKAPGKLSRITANQKKELDAIADHGGVSILADNATTVKEALDVWTS